MKLLAPALSLVKVVYPVDDPNRIKSEFVNVCPAVQVFAFPTFREQVPLVVMVPPLKPPLQVMLDIVPAFAHWGVAPAPCVCRTWPLVPGVRASHAEAPR